MGLNVPLAPSPTRHFERRRPTLFLSASLLRNGRPAQREISLLFVSLVALVPIPIGSSDKTPRHHTIRGAFRASITQSDAKVPDLPPSIAETAGRRARLVPVRELWNSAASPSAFWSCALMGKHTAVRLKVEQNQLVRISD